MIRVTRWWVLVASFVVATLIPTFAAATPSRAQVDAKLSRLAIPFVENVGQTDVRVAYYAPTFAGTLFVTRHGEIVHALSDGGNVHHRSPSPGWALTERFEGGRAVPSAAQPSATNVSLFLGSHAEDWRAHAPTFGAVNLGEVYAGIGVQLKAYGKQVEKVFTVRPGAAVAAIRVRVSGAQHLAVAPDGALVVDTGLGEVRLTRPAAYQELAGRHAAINVSYTLAGDTYGFRVDDYDPRRALVIDPLLQATYLGAGGGDVTSALALRATTGEVYVAGYTDSRSFPGTSGGAQSSHANDCGFLNTCDVHDTFVARLSPDLTRLDQATFHGGTGDDKTTGLALNQTNGDVYVAGFTNSGDFPGTSGGAQSSFVGPGLIADAFVARLSADLTTLDQATYLGGNDRDNACALAINATTGEVYVAGFTNSTDLPGTSGGAFSRHANDENNADAFVARLNPSLTHIDNATYLGGSDHDDALAIALQATTGEVYVAGFTDSTDFPSTSGGAQSTHANDGDSSDAFVARLSADLTAVDQATYLGGTSKYGGLDGAYALALNAATGDVYVAGYTNSSDFPKTSGGAQSTLAVNGPDDDAFVARLNANLTTLDQATYLGGSGEDFAQAVVLNPATGEVFVAGETYSTDFPRTAGGVQSTQGGMSDAFVARLNPSLTHIDQATYLGGSDLDGAFALAFNPTTGELYVGGDADSSDFPGTTGGAQSMHANDNADNDVFVARLSADLTA